MARLKKYFILRLLRQGSASFVRELTQCCGHLKSLKSFPKTVKSYTLASKYLPSTFHYLKAKMYASEVQSTTLSTLYLLYTNYMYICTPPYTTIHIYIYIHIHRERERLGR